MSENLEYSKGEKISLKKHFNEKWLQDRIEEDPSILGLGDLDPIQREKKKSSGGRIDFLFLNNETETMYETEIQLGATDESHIIRTIEYWDIENMSNENGESTVGETHIIIAKHRNGSLETIKLRAKLTIQKFEEWDDDNNATSGWRPITPNLSASRNVGSGDGTKLFIQKGSKMN